MNADRDGHRSRGILDDLPEGVEHRRGPPSGRHPQQDDTRADAGVPHVLPPLCELLKHRLVPRRPQRHTSTI